MDTSSVASKKQRHEGCCRKRGGRIRRRGSGSITLSRRCRIRSGSRRLSVKVLSATVAVKDAAAEVADAAKVEDAAAEVVGVGAVEDSAADVVGAPTAIEDVLL